MRSFIYSWVLFAVHYAFACRALVFLATAAFASRAPAVTPVNLRGRPKKEPRQERRAPKKRKEQRAEKEKAEAVPCHHCREIAGPQSHRHARARPPRGKHQAPQKREAPAHAGQAAHRTRVMLREGGFPISAMARDVGAVGDPPPPAI